MSEDAGNIAAALIGAWQLVACTMTLPDGSTTYPFGREPCGAILYTPDGWMSAHLMDCGPATDAAPSAPRYSGYFGPFTVSEKDSLVIHHVRGASDARIVNDQPRTYRIEGDRLVLSAEMNGASIEVVWSRPA